MENKHFFNNSSGVIRQNKAISRLNTANNLISGLEACSSQTARDMLSFEDACKYQVLPLALKDTVYGQRLDLISIENQPEDLSKELAFITSVEVKIIPIKQDNLIPAIVKAYKADCKNLDQLKEKLIKNQDTSKFNKNLIIKEQADNTESAFLKVLIEYAIAKEASDIHIIPKVKGSYIKLRINGELFQHPDHVCSIEQHKTIINRLKVLSNLNISESRLPQDGSFKFTLAKFSVQIRLSLMPNVEGEKAVLRLQKVSNILSIEEINLDLFTLNALRKVLRSESGLIVFCGPTGSGKTTTMYAALGELLHSNCSIVSIEDPVEIEFQQIDQTCLKPELNFNYPQALRSVLRQDPDVILLGEIRDSESAKIVIQAALSGHLILTTIHAANVFQVVKRLMQFSVHPEMLATCLKLIVNQRLVPLTCMACQGLGCEQCSFSSYSERLLIAETLLINESISKRIAENKLSIHNVKNSKNHYQSYKPLLKKLLTQQKINLRTYNKINE